MSNTLRTLSNIRSLRVLARETSLEQLESLLEKLTTVIEEKREEVKAQEAEQAKFLEQLKKYEEMLANDGISADELASLLGKIPTEKKARNPIAPRPAKYRFVDANGNEKTWTGQGRTPRELVGKNLADFEI